MSNNIKLSEKIYEAILENLNHRKGFDYWHNNLEESVKVIMKADIVREINALLVKQNDHEPSDRTI